MYDMRYPQPIFTLNHHYRLPIHSIKFHRESKKILTADKKIIKIFSQTDGKLFTNIEPKAQINDVELCGEGSGLIFAPLEQEKIGTYFIPEMGHAPKWCAFLENLTEEMEESNSTSLYDDFKFLTNTELEKLNATHLIGTPMLKAYMHGYFMELKAYQKLAQTSDPFAFEKFKKEQIDKKLQKQRERIQVEKRKSLLDTDASQVKVNQEFVDELIAQATQTGNKKVKTKAGDVEKLITDDRFKGMFEDEEFKRDPNSEAYRLLRPVSNYRQQKHFLF